jgi:hypothetical protein
MSLSTGLLSGGEGWGLLSIGIGAEAGTSVTYSYGVSATNLGKQGAAIVDQFAKGLADSLSTLATVGKGISDAIRSAFQSLFAIFDPASWDLTGYTPGEQASWQDMGKGLRAAMAKTTLQQFLADEQKPVSVASRLTLGQEGGVLSLIGVTEAVNRRYHELHPEAAGQRIWEANDFNSRSYLDFLRVCADNGLIKTQSAGSPPFQAAPAQ